VSRSPKPVPDPWSPRLSALYDCDDLVPTDGLRVEATRLTRTDWSGCRAAQVDLEGSHLVKVRLTQAEPRLFRARDTLFEECDLSGADLSESSLYRVEFRGCKMIGFVAGGAKFERVRFVDCQLEMSSLRALEAEDCEFRSSDMRDSDFEMAVLERVSFGKCQLGGTSFRQARMQDVDLRSSEVSGLRYVHGLKGATIEPIQLFDLADAMAREIGIVVTGDR